MTNQTPQTNRSEEQQQPLDLSRAKMILRVWAEANLLIGELRIFGSYAKGTASPDSDLDVAVRVVRKLPGDTSVWVTSLCECPRWGEELSRILGVKVDVQDITGDHVSQFVQDASILIYQDEGKALRSVEAKHSSNEQK